jgi:HD-GYP domain-containing protein (c-di-GMP phosphodiesterase class II)
VTAHEQPDRSPEAAVDELHRMHGVELVRSISAVIRIGRAYSVTNPVYKAHVAGIAQAIRPVLDRSGEAVILAIESDLHLNGVRLPVTAPSLRFHQTVLDAFKSRAIAGIRIERLATADELSRFFAILLQPTCTHGATLLKACADAGLQRVLPAIHASTGTHARVAAPDPAPSSGAGGVEPARPGARRVEAPGIRHHLQALDAARHVLAAAAGGRLEMRHAKRAVQPLVDGAAAHDPIVAGGTAPREHDAQGHVHAVHVCAVALGMGHALGMDRRALADLGAAALLHDVGQASVQAEIGHPPGSFTPEERALAVRHPIEGAKAIAASTSLNATSLRCIRAALEHHQDPEGKGYPDLGKHGQPSLLTQTIALADCYVTLHARRERRTRITPHEALGMILGPLRERFEPALVWALIRSVGFYPPGQLVELDDRSIAVALSPNPADPARPGVRLVFDSAGRRLAAKEQKELAPLPERRSVKRALTGAEYPATEPARRAA